jgi:hypothetical protein
MEDSELCSRPKAKQYCSAAWTDAFWSGTRIKVPLCMDWHTKKVSGFHVLSVKSLTGSVSLSGDIIQAVAVSRSPRRVKPSADVNNSSELQWRFEQRGLSLDWNQQGESCMVVGACCCWQRYVFLLLVLNVPMNTIDRGLE